MIVFKKMSGKKKAKKSGFTLVEMIVSVALFSIVVTVSTGALLQVLATNQRAQAIETVMNNLDFALQQMARDIRVGTNYTCNAGNDNPSLDISASHDSASPDSPCQSFSFTAQGNSSISDPHRIIYGLYSSGPNSGSIFRSIAGGTPYPITASQIIITNLSFYVSGSTPGIDGDQDQPKVLIVLQGYVKIKNDRTNFNLQTTVSQRLLDR